MLNYYKIYSLIVLSFILGFAIYTYIINVNISDSAQSDQETYQPDVRKQPDIITQILELFTSVSDDQNQHKNHINDMN